MKNDPVVLDMVNTLVFTRCLLTPTIKSLSWLFTLKLFDPSLNARLDPELGIAVGSTEGTMEGKSEGKGVGATEGEEGAAEGSTDGIGVGTNVGSELGIGVGVTDGMGVGRNVGSPANSSIKTFFNAFSLGEIEAATVCLNDNSANGLE